MTFNAQGLKSAKKFYSIDPNYPFLISEKYFQNRGSFVLHLSHYYPKSAFKPNESSCLVPCRSNQILLSYDLAHSLCRELPKILPSPSELIKEKPVYSDWKYPENSIVTILPTGQIIDTTEGNDGEQVYDFFCVLMGRGGYNQLLLYFLAIKRRKFQRRNR